MGPAYGGEGDGRDRHRCGGASAGGLTPELLTEVGVAAYAVTKHAAVGFA